MRTGSTYAQRPDQALHAGLRERSKAHKEDARVIEESFTLLKDAGCIFEREEDAEGVGAAAAVLVECGGF